MLSAALSALSLALGAQAAESLGNGQQEDGNVATSSQWTLSTDDTRLKVSVSSNRIYISDLRNPAQKWNWTPAPSEVPLVRQVRIGSASYSPAWNYREAAIDRSNGTQVTLRFSSAAPDLELKSIWRVRPGVGPVENKVFILNRTGTNVVLNGNDIEAANLNLVADSAVQFFPGDAGVVGFGETAPLPYQIIKVGSTHGIYIAYDYGCGQYASTRHPNPLRINSRFWVGNGVSTVIEAGETFKLPGIMILTYQGDEDDAANHFRKWFWNYEITPSLKNNPKEPPIEICNDPGHDGKPDFLVDQAKTTDFAGWGVGCLKTDAWHWEGTQHARSDELAAALHARGVKLSLYFNGPIPEKVLLDEAAKSHFDYYRSDAYTKPAPFDMNDYHSVESFKRKLDTLAKVGVGWENCCNGGNLRSLDICRRMTFMTHSDAAGLVAFFPHVYSWSYLIPPIQIKCDYAVGNPAYPDTSTAYLRGFLLGSILAGFPTDAKFIESLDRIKKVFSLYNSKQRAILRGADVYRILPLPTPNQWFGLQYFNTFIDRGSVLLWQNGGETSRAIKLKGLSRSATYTLTFEDATSRNCTMTGARLMDDGVNVPMGANASEIIWIDGPDAQAGTEAGTRTPDQQVKGKR
ncbi:MAG: GH36 C-terminal domain-containing protein [Kiritimatiellae bacterium]|nr:GH36 C-terminal domain-containing protein [Kiritimatiellia bacterium]